MNKNTWINESGAEEGLTCAIIGSTTCGLIVGCLDHDLAKVIRKKFANREISKTYLAITSGFLALKSGTWKDPLIEKEYRETTCPERWESNGNHKFRKIRSTSGKMNLELLELVLLQVKLTN